MSATGGNNMPATHHISQSDAVNIVTWILLITSALSVLARLVVKWTTSKGLHIDDGFAIIALLCHVGSGASVSIMAKNGLGHDLTTLTGDERRIFAKTLFTSNIFFIATLCFAKISIITLFNLITSTPRHIKIGRALNIFIVIWASVSCIALGVNAGVPRIWDISSRGNDKPAFWYAFEGLNVLTDVIVVIFTMYITVPLQMAAIKKIIVLSCFGARIFDIIATIIQLVYTHCFSSADLSNDIVPWILMSQVIQCITVITSCIPYLRPLLESIPSGMLMSDEIRRKDRTAGSTEHYVRDPDYGYILQGSKTGSAPSGSTPFSAHSAQENHSQVNMDHNSDRSLITRGSRRSGSRGS